MEHAPARYRVPAKDWDGDGAPDVIYKQLTYTENSEPHYKASLSIHFASGEIVPLVEDDNGDKVSVEACDFTGNGSSDLLISLISPTANGIPDVGRHFVCTKNEDGEWELLRVENPNASAPSGQ